MQATHFLVICRAIDMEKPRRRHSRAIYRAI
jgi:hypothetical protein